MSDFGVKVPDKNTFIRYSFGFHSKYQMDFFMVIREEWVDGEVVFAAIVFGTHSMTRKIKKWCYQNKLIKDL